jgi:DNA-directed RNA polymerase specialized sigma24 family protein
MTTWLTTIVRNCALMHLRKRPRQIHLPLDEQTGGEEKYFVWESLADTRPSPEEECRNLELKHAYKGAPYGCPLLYGEHFSCVS